MRSFLTKFWGDRSGISSVEYALLLAFVAAGIIFGAEALSTAVQGELVSTAECLEDSSTCTTTATP